jgi:hypothetical protein
VACPDGQALQVARRLKTENVVFSNMIVVDAAHLLLLKKEIEPFSLVWINGQEYHLDEDGYFNDFPTTIDMTFRLMTSRLRNP